MAGRPAAPPQIAPTACSVRHCRGGGVGRHGRALREEPHDRGAQGDHRAFEYRGLGSGEGLLQQWGIDHPSAVVLRVGDVVGPGVQAQAAPPSGPWAGMAVPARGCHDAAIRRRARATPLRATPSASWNRAAPRPTVWVRLVHAAVPERHTQPHAGNLNGSPTGGMCRNPYTQPT